MALFQVARDVNCQAIEYFSVPQIAELVQASGAAAELVRNCVTELRSPTPISVPLSTMYLLPKLMRTINVYPKCTVAEFLARHNALPPAVQELLVEVTNLDELTPLYQALLLGRVNVVVVSALDPLLILQRWRDIWNTMQQPSYGQLKLWTATFRGIYQPGIHERDEGDPIQVGIWAADPNAIYLSREVSRAFSAIAWVYGLTQVVHPVWQSAVQGYKLGLLDPKQPPSTTNPPVAPLIAGQHWFDTGVGIGCSVPAILVNNGVPIHGDPISRELVVSPHHPIVQQLFAFSAANTIQDYEQYIPIVDIVPRYMMGSLADLFAIRHPIVGWPDITGDAYQDLLESQTNTLWLEDGQQIQV